MFQSAEMLTDRLANHLAIEVPHASEIQIKRIELFVIPAISIDAPGYRVCMRITAALGYGWSETFIEKKEKPSDWVHWSSCLVHYINTGNDYNREDNTLDSRLRHMFVTAVDQISSHRLQTAAADSAESVERAVGAGSTASLAEEQLEQGQNTGQAAEISSAAAAEREADAENQAAAAVESGSEPFTEDVTLLARSECYISLF
ncbi:hypothetical protein [Paenibacillus protaetiae]|uniref:Uncharacterized protein n=1 Tax=Paenibacillus protaetiae TaxID=2509456 RepID=A0A4P6EUP1_9BACL|nr:hypothetical protein [Paenibacillus protaetiae]QAY66664.1 hypothetical protein ET464_09845 [Paenibacillus protaetiae]